MCRKQFQIDTSPLEIEIDQSRPSVLCAMEYFIYLLPDFSRVTDYVCVCVCIYI